MFVIHVLMVPLLLLLLLLLLFSFSVIIIVFVVCSKVFSVAYENKIKQSKIIKYTFLRKKNKKENLKFNQHRQSRFVIYIELIFFTNI